MRLGYGESSDDVRIAQYESDKGDTKQGKRFLSG